ncbi:Undecaprenyl-diphosphatase [bioreactor metagenome]|uniref:Undecaprenyl-diphosphatase n=2 Tax=root TaxID=1 RepID=A0ABS4K0N7_9CLOT|nr:MULTISPECIES: undecaprenyl-diphosphate phosphatase [Clostridium]EQB87108.1 UDP pyrophosphate phosphatase [Clostridium sp. BL8]MBP2021354.1 undecaprenyl-diphosphatase [Clostridium punense]
MEIFEILKAILFGIVEGITEWLPISSTGHMILLDEFVKLNVSEAFMEMFLVVIQLGAILAVVVTYWKKLFPFSLGRGKLLIKKDIMIMWVKIVAACIPAALVGVLWDDKIEALFYNYKTVAIMLILFGILFIVVENRNKGKKSKINTISQITFKAALMVGFFQLIAAVFPGTSRSGATILGGIFIGMSRTIAAEFTFFMAVPVMFGASLLKLVKFGLAFSGSEVIILLVGMVTAYVVSVVIIKFLMQYIKNRDFKIFGWYRIVLGVIVLLYFWLV